MCFFCYIFIFGRQFQFRIRIYVAWALRLWPSRGRKTILFNNYRLKQPSVIIPLFAGPPHTNAKPLKVNCVRSHHMWICLMFGWVFDSLFSRGLLRVCVFVCWLYRWVCSFRWKKRDDAAERRAWSTCYCWCLPWRVVRSEKGGSLKVKLLTSAYSQTQCQCTHIRFLIEPQFRIMHFKSPSNSQC